MKLKYIIFICLVELLVLFFIDNTYAINENDISDIENINLDIFLEYNENENENIFTNSIFNFIDLVDDSLISTATFNMSDKLNDNYDFLTVFAINFILNNEEYYKDDIITGNDYVYDDGYNKYTTNKYVDIDVIYEITNNILGKRDYYIVNEYLNVENNLIPLLLLKDYNFSMELEKIIDVEKINDDYEVYVKYKDMDLVYKYIFEFIDNKLIINNLEVY